MRPQHALACLPAALVPCCACTFLVQIRCSSAHCLAIAVLPGLSRSSVVSQAPFVCVGLRWLRATGVDKLAADVAVVAVAVF